MRKDFIALVLISVSVIGCSIVRNGGKSPATTEQNLASVMDAVSNELDVAVAYYSAQKTACANPPQATCRFSKDGLEGFRLGVFRANDLFMIAAKDFLAYKMTGANLPAVQSEVMTAAASIALLPKEAH